MFASIAIVRALADELHAVDPLRSCVMPPDLLATMDDMRNRILLSDLERLIERAIAMTREPSLGLTVAARAPAHLFQLVGHAATSARTLREAFEIVRTHAWLIADGLELDMTTVNNTVELRLAFEDVHGGLLARFTNEFLAAHALRIASAFGENRPPHRLLVRHSKPSNCERYEAAFRCPVEFGQPENVLVVSAAAFTREQIHYDRATFLAIRDALAHFAESVRGRTLGTRVEEILRMVDDRSGLTQGDVARVLGVSSRALRRRLAHEGVGLTTLAEKVRCDLAKRELLRSGGSVKRAAELAGYSESSSFCRAFKRWTGERPSHFRRARLSEESRDNPP